MLIFIGLDYEQTLYSCTLCWFVALMAMEAAGLSVEFRHVPAHVGIVGNEKADKLTATGA